MTRPPNVRAARLGIALLSLSVSFALRAQTAPTPTASDWGGIGLLQTPTARMADEGELSFTASHTSPNSRYSVVLQPLPWLEGGFRYVSVANRRYGPEWLSGNQNNKDKSIDLKIRLLQEGPRLPEVSAGFRDIGGTGLFSSEYIVASKRWGAIDVSMGLATGYIGNRGDFKNPLTSISDKFEGRRESARAGKINSQGLFRGPVGVFGGISYQTPWEPLQLKLEYDGNDYRHEPQKNNLDQHTPFNFGASYSLNQNVQLHAGWERGNTVMLGLTLHSNLAKARSVSKPLDPPPANARDISHSTGHHASTGQEIDWPSVASDLESNAGVRVQSISRRGRELVVAGEQRRFFYPAQGAGRALRVLDSHLDDNVDWITVRSTRLGVDVVDASVQRTSFADYLEHRTDISTLARHVELSAPSSTYLETLYRAPIKRYEGALNIGYRQSLGGPDGFILFQVATTYTADLRFNQNLWLNGTVSYNAYNNYEKFRYDAPSNLPRVRTYVRQYLTTEDLTLPSLQLTATKRISRDLYGSAYGGLLEPMYGGVGGELLYRPLDERWAIGAELNWVKQRDFDQRLSFREYSVATGHASFYYVWGNERKIVSTVSIGRYLAKDVGGTLAVSRAFNNGVSMGAYATKTNVSTAEFGEGSFDKGIFISVPFDFMLPRSTRARANFTWNPLYRDGGARLARNYGLYQATSERDPDFFFDNLSKISD